MLAAPVAAQVPATEYAARRAALAARLDSGVVVAYGGVETVAAWPTFYQTPAFYYLTGFAETDAALVMVKRNGTVAATMFVPTRTAIQERWVGARTRVGEMQAKFGVAGRDIAELQAAAGLAGGDRAAVLRRARRADPRQHGGGLADPRFEPGLPPPAEPCLAGDAIGGHAGPASTREEELGGDGTAQAGDRDQHPGARGGDEGGRTRLWRV